MVQRFWVLHENKEGYSLYASTACNVLTYAQKFGHQKINI